MSLEQLQREAERWLRQARDDLEAAHVLADAKHYAQACFLSQQATEKALKALWFRLDLDPWGHSVTRLIRDLPEETRETFTPLLDAALYLDKLYIPTRYPDAIAELTPFEAYTKAETETALTHAQTFVGKVEFAVQK
jgi:HEPN domain-containing protein